jgi:hypothetical protein
MDLMANENKKKTQVKVINDWSIPTFEFEIEEAIKEGYVINWETFRVIDKNLFVIGVKND